MSFAKKVILSLSVVFTMLIAFVIGVVGNVNTHSSSLAGGGVSTEATTPSKNTGNKVTFKPLNAKTFNFNQDEVAIQGGSSSINFEYEPQANARATSVAYEYAFNNSMAVDMAVNLKSVDTTNVTLSYAYSDTKLNEVTESSYPFEAQRIISNQTKYIYVIVTPTSTSIPTTFQSSMVWYQGEAGEVNIVSNGETLAKQTLVKGQPLSQPVDPDEHVPNGYKFEGWYLDAKLTKTATFPTNFENQTLYARIPNLPTDWISGSQVIQGTSPLPSHLTIPTTYNGQNIFSIKSATSSTEGVFYNQTGLISVNLPNTLTSIGGYAFYNCTSLKSVNLHNTLAVINEQAFYNCTSLINIDLSQCTKLQTIYNKTFYNCTSLINIDLSQCNKLTTLNQSAFENCVNLSKITLPSSLITVGTKSFSRCTSLTSITLPSGLTSISGLAFERSGLKSLTVPSSVSTIGTDAFNYCTNLTSIDLSNCTGLSKIEDYTFRDDTALNNILLPNGVTSIGNSAFSGCSNLSSITLPSGLTSIADSAFSSSGLTSITLPSGLTNIQERAFSYCVNLTSVDFRKCTNLSSIGFEVFVNCIKLTSVDLRECSSLTTIGERVFMHDEKLQTVILPNGVTSIGGSAFNYCSRLTSINLPNNLTSIKYNMFENCGSLQKISIPSGVTSIEDSAFRSCGLQTIEGLGNCTNLTRIGRYAFQYCNYLTSITLPSSLTQIDEYAFFQCNITTGVVIPSGVTYIGSYAFGNCYTLPSITFADTSTWYASRSSNYTAYNDSDIKDVTNASTNVTYFVQSHSSYYWYKK